MKFLKWLLVIIIVILFGLLFMKFGELNPQTVEMNYTATKSISMNLAKFFMLSMGAGLVIGLIFMLLNIVFTELKNLKKTRRDKRNRKYRHLVRDTQNLFYKQNYSEAVSLNNKALKLKPESPEALVNQAEIMFSTGEKGKAVQIFEKVHRLVPDDMEVIARLFEIYMEDKLFGEALQLAKEIHEADEKNLGIIFTLRDLYVQLKDWDKAKD